MILLFFTGENDGLSYFFYYKKIMHGIYFENYHLIILKIYFDIYNMIN